MKTNAPLRPQIYSDLCSNRLLFHRGHFVASDLTFGICLVLVAWSLVILPSAGCLSGQKPTYPVQGKLVWDDGSPAKELAGGMVIFQCDTEEMSAKSSIDQEGGFTLGTYTLTDGAVAGTHKVSIAQPAAETGDYRPLEIVDRRYESMATTDLEVTVEPKRNDVVLKVSPGAWMKKKKR
jgi:hypothetical protein